MTLIDRDELLKHEVMIITKGNAAFHGVPSSLIETAPVIDLKNLQPVWRDPETDPPKVEEDVLILFETACGGYGITTAHYEDGTLLSQDSIFYWDELAAWGELDEEHDDYIIPKGWWEYRYFNQDDVYNNRIDCPVMGWMPLPPEVLKEVMGLEDLAHFLMDACHCHLAAGNGCPGCPFDKPTSNDGDGECRLGVPSDWDF